jgi:very-short-patch-repair endonuclease
MTEHEQLIWYHIRRKQLNNIQFYRQKHLGPFIVDFYAPSIRLVIEIDGSQHFEERHYEQDKFRDAYLGGVLEKLYRIIQQINNLKNEK